jgi:RHS repeat-associated protein
VTSVADEVGAVRERFAYTPYGQKQTLTAGWATTSDAYVVINGHQGGRLDAATGLVHFRHRDYDPSTGTWTTADPLGYPDGVNRYRYCASSPVQRMDPVGLSPSPIGYPGPMTPDGQPLGVPPPPNGGQWLFDPYIPTNGMWVPDPSIKRPGYREPRVRWDPEDNHWDEDPETPITERGHSRRIRRSPGGKVLTPAEAHDPARPNDCPNGTASPITGPNSAYRLVEQLIAILEQRPSSPAADILMPPPSDLSVPTGLRFVFPVYILNGFELDMLPNPSIDSQIKAGVAAIRAANHDWFDDLEAGLSNFKQRWDAYGEESAEALYPRAEPSVGVMLDGECPSVRAGARGARASGFRLAVRAVLAP